MENRLNDSITRAQRNRILNSALALSLGFGLFASNGSVAFGQQQPGAPESPTVSGQQQPEAPKDAAASDQQPSMEKVAANPPVRQAAQQQAPMASPAELSRTFISVAKRIRPAVVQINIVAGSQRPVNYDDPDDSAPADPQSNN